MTSIRHGQRLPHHRVNAIQRADFREGFLAMLPLWTGAILSGVAFGVAARGVGFSAAGAQLMSLFVFSAAGQLSALSLLESNSSTVTILLTALALHAQFPLLGFAIVRQLQPSTNQKLLAAAVLTDAAFGIAAGRPPLRLYVLIGAGVSMYLGWNLGTALGLVAGSLFGWVNTDLLLFVIPLTFLAVLVPQVRSTPAALTVLVAVVITIVLSPLAPSGVVILLAGLTACAVGGMSARRSGRHDDERSLTVAAKYE